MKRKSNCFNLNSQKTNLFNFHGFIYLYLCPLSKRWDIIWSRWFFMIHNKLCSFFVVWKFPFTIILTIQHWVTLNFSKTTKVLKKCLESSISIHWLLENYVLIGFFLVYQYIINELFYQRWTIESRYLSQELLQVKILGNYLNKLFRSVEF